MTRTSSKRRRILAPSKKKKIHTHFFQKWYPLQGVKKLEFEKFCKVALIIKTNGHLTAEGLDEIFKIKEIMNKICFSIFSFLN